MIFALKCIMEREKTACEVLLYIENFRMCGEQHFKPVVQVGPTVNSILLWQIRFVLKIELYYIVVIK